MSMIRIDIDDDNVLRGIVQPMLFYFIVFIIIFFTSGYLISKNITCPQLGSTVHKETTYNPWAGGCFIQESNGNWVSSGSYNGVNIENLSK